MTASQWHAAGSGNNSVSWEGGWARERGGSENGDMASPSRIKVRAPLPHI